MHFYFLASRLKFFYLGMSNIQILYYLFLHYVVSNNPRTGMGDAVWCLWRRLSLTLPCPRQAQLELLGQNHVQLGCEYLHQQRLCSLSVQPVSMFNLLYSNFFHSSLNAVSCVSLYARCLFSCQWTALGGVQLYCLYFVPPHLGFIHLDKVPLESSPLWAEQSQLPQRLFICEVIQSFHHLQR